MYSRTLKSHLRLKCVHWPKEWRLVWNNDSTPQSLFTLARREYVRSWDQQITTVDCYNYYYAVKNLLETEKEKSERVTVRYYNTPPIVWRSTVNNIIGKYLYTLNIYNLSIHRVAKTRNTWKWVPHLRPSARFVKLNNNTV